MFPCLAATLHCGDDLAEMAVFRGFARFFGRFCVFFFVFSMFFGFLVFGIFVFPQTVCPHYGVLTVGVRSGVLEVSFRNCAGSHRVPFASTVSHGMVDAGFWVVLPGVRALFEAKRGFT